MGEDPRIRAVAGKLREHWGLNYRLGLSADELAEWCLAAADEVSLLPDEGLDEEELRKRLIAEREESSAAAKRGDDELERGYHSGRASAFRDATEWLVRLKESGGDG